MTSPRKANQHDVAVDANGNILPISPTDVRAVVERAMEEGMIIAVVVQLPTGDLAVNVCMHEPSERLCEALDVAAAAYRRITLGRPS